MCPSLCESNCIGWRGVASSYSPAGLGMKEDSKMASKPGQCLVQRFTPCCFRFHGEGTLHFPNGGQFEAQWEDGYAMGEGSGGTYTFADGLKHKENDWEYCNLADRRFYSEICDGIKPAGIRNIATTPPPKMENLDLPLISTAPKGNLSLKFMHSGN